MTHLSERPEIETAGALSARDALRKKGSRSRVVQERIRLAEEEREEPLPDPEICEKLDHYKRLELSETASAAEIVSAYKRLRKKYHPDRHTQEKNTADRLYKLITDAYDVLSNQAKKDRYDKHRNTPVEFTASTANGFGADSHRVKRNPTPERNNNDLVASLNEVIKRNPGLPYEITGQIKKISTSEENIEFALQVTSERVIAERSLKTLGFKRERVITTVNTSEIRYHKIIHLEKVGVLIGGGLYSEDDPLQLSPISKTEGLGDMELDYVILDPLTGKELTPRFTDYKVKVIQGYTCLIGTYDDEEGFSSREYIIAMRKGGRTRLFSKGVEYISDDPFD